MGTPKVKSTSWRSSHVLLAYSAKRGGETVTLWGVGAGDGGGGILACRSHVAPHCRQTLAIHENSDIHGPTRVDLLQCSIRYEGRKARRMWVAGWLGAHGSGLMGLGLGAKLKAVVRGICRWRGVWEAHVLCVIPHQSFPARLAS